ncbi:hypothetical protein PF006_g9904 [Phytophthora fragariae]|uniref:Prolyl 4-hydroxylase alpha subunit Fe(2+) 2OG dioxygenase domain-containing protein n=1 Tax=Phytophthora fragariae TaxID=53985 RepID=A0A6A3U5G7_9STRA|nr:hypothetical protein PF011_g9363 [Phytophthora fragariae]KAE9145222.1 hypothetical protein PF006_g9904 [Phytophthora fragariae]
MSESDEEPERLENQDPNFEEDFGGKEWPFSGKRGPDEIPLPTGAACVKINDVSGGLSEKFRDFSFGGQGDQLPAIPGIFVDGVGPVPVPLWEERAQRLIEKCEKSPFGHNIGTKMDENVRKSWELQPDHVQFRNPMWKTGMEKMAATIADRLGYKDIPLHCVLYKLLVYGEGGHFLKHQDTEKKDGMIATLVVQPPSLHEGGDLECGNSTLVSVFFSKFFSRVKEKHAVVLDIAKLVRKFAWGVIGKALLEALICVDWNQDDIYVMQTTLAVVRALERGQAQQDLLSFAVGKAESLPDDRLISSRSLEELWRLVLSDSDDGILSTLSRKFERMNPRLSAPAVEIFSRYLRDNHLPEERRALLVAILSCHSG